MCLHVWMCAIKSDDSPTIPAMSGIVCAWLVFNSIKYTVAKRQYTHKHIHFRFIYMCNVHTCNNHHNTMIEFFCAIEWTTTVSDEKQKTNEQQTQTIIQIKQTKNHQLYQFLFLSTLFAGVLHFANAVYFSCRQTRCACVCEYYKWKSVVIRFNCKFFSLSFF